MKDATALLSLMKYSVKKILFSKRIIIAGLITIFIAGVMGYVSTQEVERLGTGTDLFDLLILFFFLPVISMVYGSSVIRDEIEDKSITQLLISPLDRTLGYFGYYTSLVISLMVMISIMTTSSFLIYFGNLGMDSEALGILFKILLLDAIGVLVYSSLFLMVSVITDKSIYFGLFYAFIWEGFIGSIPGSIRKFAIKHYVRSIGSEWLEYGSITTYEATGVGTSAQVIIIITVSLLILGALLFRYKEFP